MRDPSLVTSASVGLEEESGVSDLQIKKPALPHGVSKSGSSTVPASRYSLMISSYSFPDGKGQRYLPFRMPQILLRVLTNLLARPINEEGFVDQGEVRVVCELFCVCQ